MQAIADVVGLSPSACQRRIVAMEKAGVIEGYSARLSPAALGISMIFYLEITLNNQTEQTLSQFEAAALALPQVLECHLMTGKADYLIKVAAVDTQAYEQLYRRAIASLPHVSHIQSSLVMKTVKPWRGYMGGRA
ncbi:MAG: Lrp/AsnC family transcriptional regulator [Pseudomonadota bacterium]